MITLEEFRNLPDEEKGERYKDMSDHDKYLWRITCPIFPTVIKNSELSPEKRKKVTKIRERLLSEGEITQEEFNELEKEDA